MSNPRVSSSVDTLISFVPQVIQYRNPSWGPFSSSDSVRVRLPLHLDVVAGYLSEPVEVSVRTPIAPGSLNGVQPVSTGPKIWGRNSLVPDTRRHLSRPSTSDPVGTTSLFGSFCLLDPPFVPRMTWLEGKFYYEISYVVWVHRRKWWCGWGVVSVSPDSTPMARSVFRLWNKKSRLSSYRIVSLHGVMFYSMEFYTSW